MRQTWLNAFFVAALMSGGGLAAQDFEQLALEPREVPYHRQLENRDVVIQFAAETSTITVLKDGTTVTVVENACSAEFFGDRYAVVTSSGDRDNFWAYSLKDGSVTRATLAPLLMTLSYNEAAEVMLASDRQFGNVLVLDLVSNTVKRLDKYPRFCFYVGSFANGQMLSVGTSDFNDTGAHQIRFYDKTGTPIASSGIDLGKYSPDLASFVLDRAHGLVFVNSSWPDVVVYSLNAGAVVSKRLSSTGKIVASVDIQGKTYYVFSNGEEIRLYNVAFQPVKTWTLDKLQQGYDIARVSYSDGLLTVFYYRIPR